MCSLNKVLYGYRLEAEAPEDVPHLQNFREHRFRPVLEISILPSSSVAWKVNQSFHKYYDRCLKNAQLPVSVTPRLVRLVSSRVRGAGAALSGVNPTEQAENDAVSAIQEIWREDGLEMWLVAVPNDVAPGALGVRLHDTPQRSELRRMTDEPTFWSAT